ncbi:MAG: hypothetical protein LUC19_01010 [Oscillospiraceae bacterium]|nr:hypothetical protein [Oscillospiraceae bacterium]
MKKETKSKRGGSGSAAGWAFIIIAAVSFIFLVLLFTFDTTIIFPPKPNWGVSVTTSAGGAIISRVTELYENCSGAPIIIVAGLALIVFIVLFFMDKKKQ